MAENGGTYSNLKNRLQFCTFTLRLKYTFTLSYLLYMWCENSFEEYVRTFSEYFIWSWLKFLQNDWCQQTRQLTRSSFNSGRSVAFCFNLLKVTLLVQVKENSNFTDATKMKKNIISIFFFAVLTIFIVGFWSLSHIIFSAN